jgi:N-acetylmuramoyl-L-alanine amidase
MTALEASLKVAQAAVVYSEQQIQNAVNHTTANIVFDRQVLELPQKPFIIEGVTYVPIREVCEKLGFNVAWNNQNVVTITKGDMRLEFKIGTQECLVNGKTETMPYTMVVNGKTMVPLRFLSKTFGLQVSWIDSLKTVVITSAGDNPTQMELEKILNKQTNYSQEDLYWLSRIVSAEASGESYEGKLAVANCILNRVKSKDFPDTIKEVIFDTRYAVQYEPTMNGEIYKQPSDESVQAAIAALNGNDNSQGALYFMNARLSTSNWIAKNRKYAFAIENHNFYY